MIDLSQRAIENLFYREIRRLTMETKQREMNNMVLFDELNR